MLPRLSLVGLFLDYFLLPIHIHFEENDCEDPKYYTILLPDLGIHFE